MNYAILKSFGYSANGTELEYLMVGGEHDIRDDLAPGLLDGGFIGALPAEADASEEVFEDPAQPGGEQGTSTRRSRKS